MPLHRRLPKRGFTNITAGFPSEASPIYLEENTVKLTLRK
jgi:ribosomal protein L15